MTPKQRAYLDLERSLPARHASSVAQRLDPLPAAGIDHAQCGRERIGPRVVERSASCSGLGEREARRDGRLRVGNLWRGWR